MTLPTHAPADTAAAHIPRIDVFVALELPPLAFAAPRMVAAAEQRGTDVTLRPLRQLADVGAPLRLTLGDLTAMAHLGDYYACKVLAAVELGLHLGTAKPRNASARSRISPTPPSTGAATPPLRWRSTCRNISTARGP